MPASNFRVRKYKHPRWKFVVRSKVTGRWVRKFFGTKGEADTYAELKEIELLNQGVEGTVFSSDLRILAQRAATILDPYGTVLAFGALTVGDDVLHPKIAGPDQGQNFLVTG